MAELLHDVHGPRVAWPAVDGAVRGSEAAAVTATPQRSSSDQTMKTSAANPIR
jgi:hypothetical protein